MADPQRDPRFVLAQPVDAAVIAGVPVDDVTMAQTLSMIEAFIDEGRATGRSFQIATINVDFVVNAQRDASVLAILQRADLCLPDGMPIVWHARLTGIKFRERVAGADLVPLIVDRSRAVGWRVLLFGSAAGVAESAAQLLLEKYPDAVVRGISGPFMSDVRRMDQSDIDEIVTFAPDVICVALGNPKQEKWIEAHRSALGASVLIGVGGTLDFLVGERRRAPIWMRRSGLEWLFRAVQEPRRLGRRYMRDARVFGPLLPRAAIARVRSATTKPHTFSGELDVGADRYVVDLGGRSVTTHDAAQLVGLARTANRAGKRLELVGVTAGTAHILKSANIVKMFNIT